MMTLENAVQGIEYGEHLAQWKAAFQQFYGTQQPQRDTQAEPAKNGSTASLAGLPDGTSNPYSAVLTGLQTLLDGPLFKAQQHAHGARSASANAPDAGAAPDTPAVDQDREAADKDEVNGQEQEQVQDQLEAVASTPPARSPPGSRRPRKRQANLTQVDGTTLDQEDSLQPAAAAVNSAGRQPITKRRRNIQAAATSAMPRPPPATSSLNDLAMLAAAVADEDFEDDPVLGDQQPLQDQGMLQAYPSGSVGGATATSAQPETVGGSARATRGGSRVRQRTPAPSSSGADEGDSLGMSFPLVNEDGKPLVRKEGGFKTKQQIKRLRRQQSNRESARRSRQRKAEEATMLACRVGELDVTCSTLQAKNAALAAEVQQLRGIVDMMANDAASLVTQVGELGGSVSAEVLSNLNWLTAARTTAGWANPVQAAATQDHSLDAQLDQVVS